MISHTPFTERHIGLSYQEKQNMLSTLGCLSTEEFMKQVIPARLRSNYDLSYHMGAGLSEVEALKKLKHMMSQNKVNKTYIGMGFYNTITPPVIQRNILENPAWYTAYTPYQAEISQGRLESLINFQTMICDLTKMDISNASMLDEGSACAEALTMAVNISQNKSNIVYLDNGLHPHVIEVSQTRMKAIGIEVKVSAPEDFDFSAQVVACVLAYPNTRGEVKDFKSIVTNAKAQNTLVIVDVDLLSLTLLTPPGEWGADIVVGNSQRFGVPLGNGGPHAAFLATCDTFKRQMPGRLIGVSVDQQGKKAFRLTLQTREQHIRREKATSNICTAQVLLANMAAMYAVYHGPQGIKKIATEIHKLTQVTSSGLELLRLPVRNSHFFDTLYVPYSKSAELVSTLESKGINLRLYTNPELAFGISLDESTNLDDVYDLLREIALTIGVTPLKKETIEKAYRSLGQVTHIPSTLQRSSEFLTHPVFNKYHSETKMLRYITSLQNKDVTLANSMIPLGSCTMKLNATSELMPLSWPEVSQIHPFAPSHQMKGYLDMIADLETMLCQVTGFSKISFQPNSGAQGEYAGLLVIKKYHESRGDHHRKICLIPSSAHGTNPASAVMAGFEVVVVACDTNGNIDINDLNKKAETYKDSLAALMVTYPSTHGVFEEAIQEICNIIHEFGGQVYMDGANLNALVGWVRPAELGADVSHMNLHKTFAIPHGGGGPGVGPIGVRSHLAPFLPSHKLQPLAGPQTGVTSVTSAPWGSASILTISWMYLTMMGGAGLKEATFAAILSANYISKKLENDFVTLYRGQNNRVAHECILDCRPFKSVGVEVVDIAKRLMDFGFHAPTMSWPVAGTLMVEPTESESQEELDQFIEAMKQIRNEIKKIEIGQWPQDNNPLKNAPHTVTQVCSSKWDYPYSREEAAFPLPWVQYKKYWTPVNRVNDAFGDRNVVCTCPPLNEYR
jgi:glycine dehydrogenase